MRCLLVTDGYAFNDPPSRQAAESLTAAKWKVEVLQGEPLDVYASTTPEGVRARTWNARFPHGPFRSLNRWYGFCRAVKRAIEEIEPHVVVAIMHHALAALPRQRSFRLIACIYDVPSPVDSGKLDRLIIKRAWRRAQMADIVWSSDPYKARLVQRMARLDRLPMVVHNCPPLGWLPSMPPSRDGWLRSELKRQGAVIGDKDGCILLRAGAIGEYCGLEATIRVLQRLPEDHLFLMMGRPSAQYEQKLRSRIQELGLERRAFLWPRPSDEIWRQALLGADVGHLIHGPYPVGPAQRTYELNSSLSNNRLFQYLAAGLPIISYDDPRLNELHCEVDCFRVVRQAALEEDLETVFRDLGNSPERRTQLGRLALEAHSERYHWGKQFGPVIEGLAAITQPQAPKRI